MPYTPYQDAGSAFSGGMESFLMDRAAAERQARLDAQAARAADDRHLEAEAALQEKQTENLAKLEDKERAQVEKEVTGMVPGDIPSADLIARARKYHIPLRTGIDLKQDGPKMPTRVVQNIGEKPPVEEPVTPAPIRFAGSPKDAAKQKADDELAAYIQTLPAGPERQAAEYELKTGKTAPAGMFKTAAGSDQEAVFQQNPRSGKVQRLVSGQWVDWTGDVPKGAHFMTVPPPKDNSANDAREDTRRDRNYTSAVAELEKEAQPLAEHVKSFDDLGIMLNARTPAADALIAPLVLKATVGGKSSGFRITQAEIGQVIGGRSKWEDLQAKLMAWNTDPKQALKITDEQRDELRDLAKKIRAKAYDRLQKVAKTRHSLDDAPDVDTIHRTMTKLKSDLYAGDEEPVKTAADYIKQYGGAK